MNRRVLLSLLLLPLFLTACSEPDRPTIGLYLAVQRGDIDQIERHIYWGADINQQNVDGETPLHVAAAKGRMVVVKLLLKHSAEIDAADRDGHSPLYGAVMADRTQVAQYLVEQGAAIDPDRLLMEVVDSGVTDRDVVEFLLANGADINHLDASGRTPLILAIIKSERLLTKRLIAHGADVNKPGGSGKTPLQLATDGGNQEIIRLLKRNGAR
jgi:ankyrin repeat protein